jgi:hypothetical protein
MLPDSVLGKRRNLLGYVEVATLKKKWEASEVNPVSVAVAVCNRGLTNRVALLLL